MLIDKYNETYRKDIFSISPHQVEIVEKCRKDWTQRWRVQFSRLISKHEVNSIAKCFATKHKDADDKINR